MFSSFRDSIGDDFFEQFSGLASRTADYRIRADKEVRDKCLFAGETITVNVYRLLVYDNL